MHQLRIEYRGAGGAADRIVPECDELVVEDGAAPETPDGHGHAAVAVHVQRRLGTVRLVQIHDRFGRRCRQLELLRLAPERAPRGDDGFRVWTLLEADGNGSGVAVMNRHAG